MSWRMPAEWAAHDRTLMAWPAREDMWEDLWDDAQAAYAEVANAVAAFEPVTMVARPQDRRRARAACGEGVTVSEIPIDDSWMRDSGPVFVLDGAGRRAGIDFGFNAWGEKFSPYADDAEMAARVLEHLGEESRPRGRAGAGRDPGARRRRGPLHHAADPRHRLAL